MRLVGVSFLVAVALFMGAPPFLGTPSFLATPPVAGAETWWIPPVDAPVIDPFRPPSSRYGPGNRGLEYGTTGGEVIWAVADGTVTYVGSIGGSRFVVVSHPDGLRSTYAYLQDWFVVRGQRLSQGQRLGVAGPGFHLTARLGDEYIDPALLFGGAEVVVRLMPSGSGEHGGYTRAAGRLIGRK